ncbi:MAG: phosphatidylcholine/phosphatidylserine synthase [Pyrinomonadaceae bacterium]|nr:phosphatidylcholine/phosphatidylserine synthase [Pyrinomonadaceae bacterium]
MIDQAETQPVHKGLKKGLYLLPTSFTAANIGMGFLAVLFSLRGFQVVAVDSLKAAAYFDYAAIAIGLAILFDTLDGRLARMTKTATEIGVQLDSLADVLTFGIAPVVLAYCWGIGAVFPENSTFHGFGLVVLFLYLMCGAFRLARFNLQATRPRVLIEGTPKIDKKQFVGLPIPLAAGLIASIVHISPVSLNVYGESLSRFYGVSMLILIGILGVLMISTIRYTSFKEFGMGRQKLYLILLIAAFGMLLWLYSQYLLLFVTATYVAHGVLFYLLGVFNFKSKSETAEIVD